jgi:DNA polymerase-3 subunit epsilon
MGLTGPNHLTPTVVATLLGDDGRFRFRQDGRWEVAPLAGAPAPALRGLRYAVVDVETTGSLRWRGHGIVEIAVVEVRDGFVGDTFQTLLNPGRPLPPFVTALTGITPAMVAEAPLFEHVAPEVFERLAGRVFVAHNVGFDWAFVRAHLQHSLGQAPEVPRLCTVHLARRLLPRVRRRNLDALSDHFGIEIHRRHRALDDAVATARILIRLLDEARRIGIGDLSALGAFLGAPGRRRCGRERGSRSSQERT